MASSEPKALIGSEVRNNRDLNLQENWAQKAIYGYGIKTIQWPVIFTINFYEFIV